MEVHGLFMSRARGKIYKNVRPINGKIVNKPQNDINYFDSNRENIQKRC